MKCNVDVERVGSELEHLLTRNLVENLSNNLRWHLWDNVAMTAQYDLRRAVLVESEVSRGT